MRTRLPRTDYDMLTIHSDISQKLFSLVGMDIWPDPHPSLARRVRTTTESGAKQSQFDLTELAPLRNFVRIFRGRVRT